MNKKDLILKNLQTILGNDVDGNIVEYLINIKEEDFQDFLENTVDKSNEKHSAAYNNIKEILFGGAKSQQSNDQKKSQQAEAQSHYKRDSHHKKEKKKFKDINAFQEQKKQKEGRSTCDCMGQEHEFLNNCVQCGRIHCEEEGPGPCLFCGNSINSRHPFNSEGIKQKDNKRFKENKVFDDDRDYFKLNSKNNSKENKQKMVVALDLATRRVIEGTKEDAKIREKLLENSKKHLEKVGHIFQSLHEQSQHQAGKKVNDDLINLLIQMRHKKAQGTEDLGPEDDKMPIIDYGTKVFDEDLMVNVDYGLCLSMHQPYASLLVAGVKKHEGRTWSTTHRGRLWIAAAAKQPEEDEILALETFYREYYQDTTLKFPKEYPTSVLLGCVYVDDCLDQETYRKKFPNGESESPYVLICSNPIILPIFYPIVGKHKIYPLDKEMHKCAKMALQHAKYIV